MATMPEKTAGPADGYAIVSVGLGPVPPAETVDFGIRISGFGFNVGPCSRN